MQELECTLILLQSLALCKAVPFACEGDMSFLAGMHEALALPPTVCKLNDMVMHCWRLGGPFMLESLPFTAAVSCMYTHSCSQPNDMWPCAMGETKTNATAF